MRYGALMAPLLGPLLLMAAAPVPVTGSIDDAAIVHALETFNAGAVFPVPVPSESARRKLIAGEVLRWVDKPGGQRRAVALMLSDVPRDALWMACQDPHYASNELVHELRLSRTPPDDAIWYGLLDVPSPFTDRQWVVRSWNNHALATSTGGTHWEHPWRRVPSDMAQLKARAAAGDIGPVTPEMVDKAIEVPANRGAFMAISLPSGQSLFGYHATFQVGGGIPDWAVTQWALSGLEKAFRDYEKRAVDVIPQHYRAGHEPVASGDGSAMPTY